MNSVLPNLDFLSDLKIRNDKKGSLRTGYLLILPFSDKQKIGHYDSAKEPRTFATCAEENPPPPGWQQQSSVPLQNT